MAELLTDFRRRLLWYIELYVSSIPLLNRSDLRINQASSIEITCNYFAWINSYFISQSELHPQLHLRWPSMNKRTINDSNSQEIKVYKSVLLPPSHGCQIPRFFKNRAFNYYFSKSLTKALRDFAVYLTSNSEIEICIISYSENTMNGEAGNSFRSIPVLPNMCCTLFYNSLHFLLRLTLMELSGFVSSLLLKREWRDWRMIRSLLGNDMSISIRRESLDTN